MKKYVIYIIALISIVILFNGCNNATSEMAEDEHHDEHHDEETPSVHLSELAFKSLGIKVDTMANRSLSGAVEVNGYLSVPPENSASVTAILGANVTSIDVIEGDKVSKGMILGYLAHPNLIELQTKYVQAYADFQYLKKEMERQTDLYEAKVGSGKEFQKTEAEYRSKKALVNGLEAQLGQLNLNVEQIRQGNIYSKVPIMSPINGYIEDVGIALGEYVDPQKIMFKIINPDHIHADLMIYEKDIEKIKIGQIVYFTVVSNPDKRIKAKIFSIGKNFEQETKAIHIHADILEKKDFLIPGMYIHGAIQTKDKQVAALPKSAVINDEGKSYIFIAQLNKDEKGKEWAFSMTEVITGMSSADGWTEIKLLKPLPKGTLLAWNNTYYLIAELKKSENEHHH